MVINVTVKLDLDELLESLVLTLDHDELFNFMSQLDTAVEDWDFTKRLKDHFVAECKKEGDNTYKA